MAFLVVAKTTAVASTPEAWTEFRQDVGNACREKVKGLLTTPKFLIDPLGSESFGIAVAYGSSRHDSKPRTIICVYDKKTKRVEISQEFRAEIRPNR